MDLQQAVLQFKNLMGNLNDSARVQFTEWLKDNLSSSTLPGGSPMTCNVDVVLNSIRDDLRSSLPLNAVSPTENIVFPEGGTNSDCDPKTTVHVDGFLYDEDLVDELSDQGILKRNFCQRCGSWDVKPLTFISHSASVNQIKYMFYHLAPSLRGLTVVDVGSRLGAVLYGAHLFSDASRIIGIEKDETMCKLQRGIIEKYRFPDRIQVIHDDVANQTEILQSADLLILHNVFEFFANTDIQKSLWVHIQNVVRKPGTRLITAPSLQESMHSLGMDLDLSSWVRPLPMEVLLAAGNRDLFGSEVSSESDLGDIFLYEVI